MLCRVRWPAFVAKRSNERSQCRRGLPAAGVIKVVAGERRTPLPQNPLDPSGLEISLHIILVDVGETLARQSCLPGQVGVVEHEGTLHANREGPPFLLEVPGVEPA